MKVILDNALRIRTGPDVPVFQIKELFTHPNPEYGKTLGLGLSTFGIPRDICLVKDEHKELVLPRGCIHELRKHFPCEIEQHTLLVPKVEMPDRADIDERPYQKESVGEMLKYNQGVLSAGTGSGKTAMGIDLIARRGQKALILVHTADLLQQWVWSVKKFLGVNPGIIQGGTQHLGTDITVGMMQTIAQVPYLPKDFLSAFGLVLVDECHRAPCASISNILHQLPAHYRYGVTATPYRADGMDFAIFAYVGRVVHTIDSNDLYESGAIIKPQIKALLTQSYAPNCSDYNALLAHITNDDDRNGLIVHEIGAQARDGHYCLALSARVEHAHVLHQRFQINYPDIPSGIVTGQTPKKDREAAIQAARDGALCVLFATKLADEGLDIQRLDRLFLTCPSRAHGKVIQQIGRITRPFPGKKNAVVYDFHDHLIGLADSQFKTRKYKAYKGYNIQFEAPDEDILCLLQN